MLSVDNTDHQKLFEELAQIRNTQNQEHFKANLTLLFMTKPRSEEYQYITLSTFNHCSRYPFSIGTHEDNDMKIRNPQIDLFHAKFYIKGNHALVTNLSSENPVLVNETALATDESVILSHGDIVSFTKKYNIRIDYPNP